MVHLIEVLQDFEQVSGRLMPLMLFASGVFGVVAGLIIWLGGSALRRLSLLIIGTLVGFVFALSVADLAVKPALLVGLLAGFGGALADKPAIVVLTAVLAVVIAFCFLARPFMEEPRPDASVAPQSTKMNWSQSYSSVQSLAAGFDVAVKEIFWSMPKYYWAIFAGAAAAGGLFAAMFRRTAMALCFAISGTVFIFVGMILLLLQRGTTAVSSMVYRSPLYAAVFAGMAAFGACVQLIFCKQKKEIPAEDAGSSEESDKTKSAKKSWRTS